jgi:hypothetical protein
MKLRIGCVLVGFSSLVLCLGAQTSASRPAFAQGPPPLIQFSNVATDEVGNTLSGEVNITFSLYSSQQGGEPLWTETQNDVQLDPTGHYSVQLGITKPNGVPTAMFTTGEARWLGVQIAEQAPQPRVLLLSVPYALKAGDAETIGGLPSSAFMLSNPTSNGTGAPSSTNQSNTSASPPAVVTGSGTPNYLPIWKGSTALGNSAINETGSGASTRIGINTTTPTVMFDVEGQGRFRTSTTTQALLVYQNGAGATGNGLVGVTTSPGGNGVQGFVTATTGFAAGVYGAASSLSGYGVSGQGANGVRGESTLCDNSVTTLCEGGTFFGYSAPSGSGVLGGNGITSLAGNADPTSTLVEGGIGVYGVGGSGGFADGPGAWLIGAGNAGAFGDGVLAYAGSSYAGNFVGDLNVIGTIFASTKDFKIDHPLDPANKYLYHASVESSEMMNIYTGNVTTDGAGLATVRLPDWFEALNTDFRYQLTVIGQFAQAIVAREIENHEFAIRTNIPNVKVSWQVTSVRQDAYAKTHPLLVEEEKEARLRGFYIHPELYGAPAEKQIEWARHPLAMKRMQQMRAKQHPTIRAAVKPVAAQSK